MKHLKCFNTVKVFDGNDIRKSDLDHAKYGGYLTLSQSGSSKYLVDALKKAKELNLTCINVLNVEDSAIAKVGEEMNI